VSTRAIERVVVTWNRDKADLDSDEVLAQVLDRGGLDAWRELYQLASEDQRLRARIHRLIRTVPLPHPAFLAGGAGEPGRVDRLVCAPSW